MVGCPFSQSRLVKVTNTRQIVYKAEKQACKAFPDPHADDLKAGAKRTFQLLSPLDFLAEFTQHRPSLCSGARPKDSHLIRYYGWYSNKSRGMRKKATADTSDEPLAEETATSHSSLRPHSRTAAVPVTQILSLRLVHSLGEGQSLHGVFRRLSIP